jgi:uncharacterized protein YndB with AHSA1/START domain
MTATPTLHATAAGPQLRLTRRLAHPPEKVWRAMTEPEHLAAWFPDTIVVERWEVGAPLRFEHEGGLYAFEGQVLAVTPQRALEFTWGPDTIRLELEPDGEGTRLTLLDTLEAVGKAARDGAGWHVCLDHLEHDLDGTTPPWTTTDRWREVHPGYVQALGPDAATIGPPEGALD